MNNPKKNFLDLVSKEKSNVHALMQWRKANKVWLSKSMAIAVKIMMALRKDGVSQKELAGRVGVSPQQINKIVKGSENLSLETIAKLEVALGVKLVEVELFQSTVKYEAPKPSDAIAPVWSSGKIKAPLRKVYSPETPAQYDKAA